MADDISYKTEIFYTSKMKPDPDEGVNALWARMMASNAGACWYFRTIYLNDHSLADDEEHTIDTGYDWSSRYVLILAIQDASSIGADNFAYKATNTYLNASGSGIDMVTIQALQLSDSYQNVKPLNDGSDRLQVKQASGGGISLKNISGGLAYHSLVIIGLKQVN